MHPIVVATLALSFAVVASSAFAAGDPERGARVYGVCATCHSLEPGKHLTGPSLANIIGRKAGTVSGFVRYSKALRNAGITWDEQSLDKWIANPLTMVPDTFMTFPGIRSPEHRDDLVAFLKVAGKVDAADDGDTAPYWEYNLRLKSDSSPQGPAAGKPVIVGSGMRGDRASVVFSKPEEISKFITMRCE